MGRSSETLIQGFLSRLRFPWLFMLMALLFLFDLFVPDLIPFIDELLLGGGTILLGTWKKRRSEKRGQGDEEFLGDDELAGDAERNPPFEK